MRRYYHYKANLTLLQFLPIIATTPMESNLLTNTSTLTNKNLKNKQ